MKLGERFTRQEASAHMEVYSRINDTLCATACKLNSVNITHIVTTPLTKQRFWTSTEVAISFLGNPSS